MRVIISIEEVYRKNLQDNMHILKYSDEKGLSSMGISCGFSRYSMSGNSCSERYCNTLNLYSRPYYHSYLRYSRSDFKYSTYILPLAWDDINTLHCCMPGSESAHKICIY
jgi:hypothetical protein